MALAPRLTFKNEKFLVIVGLMLALFLSSLDQTILGTALPAIAKDFGEINKISWVLVSYTVAVTVGMPVFGKLGDQFGHKKLFLWAIAIFLAGSIFASLAFSMDILIASRFIQGIGGAGIMILSQAVLADITTVRERAKYSGPLGIVFGASAILGPFIGGYLTETLSWHWNFLLNIPIGIIVFLLVLRTPAKKVNYFSTSIDYAGIITMTISVLAITFFAGMIAEPEAVLMKCSVLLVAVVSAVAFIVIELKAKNPLVPMSFFTSRTFLVCTFAGMAIGAGMFGVMAYLPAYFQLVHHVSIIQSGMLVLPMLFVLFMGNIISGIAISRTGRYRAFPVLGLLFSAAGLYLMSTASIGTPINIVIFYTTILGFGLGLSAQNIILIVQNAMPAKNIGSVTAVNAFFREIGVSFGLAIFGAVFASVLGTSTLIHDSLSKPDTMDIYPLSSGTGLYNEAFTTGFFWLVPVLFCGFIFTCFIPPTKLSEHTGEERKHHEAGMH